MFQILTIPEPKWSRVCSERHLSDEQSCLTQHRLIKEQFHAGPLRCNQLRIVIWNGSHKTFLEIFLMFLLYLLWWKLRSIFNSSFFVSTFSDGSKQSTEKINIEIFKNHLLLFFLHYTIQCLKSLHQNTLNRTVNLKDENKDSLQQKHDTMRDENQWTKDFDQIKKRIVTN